MIFYFSGTGNSRFLAQRMAIALADQAIDAAALIKENKTGDWESVGPYVFVCPTYAWRIPRVFEELIIKCQFRGSNKAYFILNCGSEIGNAGQFLKKLCVAKGFTYMGVAEIVMPENYIAMYAAPDEITAAALVAKGGAAATELAAYIKEQTALPQQAVSLADRIKSGPVNNFFYRFIVKTDKFYTTTKCTACGQCVGLCPMNNIKLTAGKPVWGNGCTHCMACICRCPAVAIEYGTHTQNLRRYYCAD